MKAKIVIGSNYGDEGKGTVVASLTKQAAGSVINVLTNGGAQRGHSVLTDKGSITFQHFGSGTYFGADNYFDSSYILNPMQFTKEYNELSKKCLVGKIYRSPDCRWSTPFDSICNIVNDQGNVGTCGMGIWETILRYRSIPAISFSSFMALDEERQRGYLKNVKKYFEEKRLANVPSVWNEPGLIDHFLQDCRFMYDNTSTFIDIAKYDECIFENGQGLLLTDRGIDEADRTPTDTGSKIINKGIISLCDDVETHYVSRPYITRHGGSIFMGCDKSVGIKEDRTNHYNDNQGEFLFGQLDIDMLAKRINTDHMYGSIHMDITHCDEVDRVDEFKKLFENVHTFDTAKV